jgi:hypothetical protein
MKIQTLIPVTYNDGIASQATGVVTGIINIVNQDYYREQYSFSVDYIDAAGKRINTVQPFTLTRDEINVFYDEIKDLVPTNIAYFETTEYIYYLGFKIEMAKTFGITPDDIEILVESDEILNV